MEFSNLYDIVMNSDTIPDFNYKIIDQRKSELESDLDNMIRFCAKDNRHYNTLNVMECCIGDKGDPDTAGSQYTECPTDYCRTSRDIDDIPNNECEVMDDEGKCFQLSDKCDDVFVKVCTQREMWGNEGEDSIETSNLSILSIRMLLFAPYCFATSTSRNEFDELIITIIRDC